MKKIRITDKDGIVNEFDASDVTVEEIDVPDAFKPIGFTEPNENYSIIESFASGGFYENPVNRPEDSDSPVIKDGKHAENYAEAMNVLFELWACDGVVLLDMENYLARDVFQMYGDLEVCSYSHGPVALCNITPPFESREAINAAIQKVGPESIKKMFRSFKFIK